MVSAAIGSTISHDPSAAKAERIWRAAATGSPMSCRQSNVVTRSYPVPENEVAVAVAVSNVTRSATPASAARLVASAIDSAW